MSRSLSSWWPRILCVFLVTVTLSAQSLTIAAASDLSMVGPELEKAFLQHAPGVQIKLVNASSSMLSEQIGRGAPFDLFLSANAEYVDKLASNRKIVPESVRVYAVGRLGILWRDGQKHPLRDLTTRPVRVVALPNPQLAPYGVAAQQALEYGGLWTMVQPKVVYGENVRQALQFLESGNADAVITSDALLQGRNAEVIPENWHKPIVQKAGIVAGSPNRAVAARFLEFLLGPDGQRILARFGFSPPNGDSP